MSYKKIFLVLFVICLFSIFSKVTFSLWKWKSSEETMVVFDVDSGESCATVNGGGNITSSEIVLAPANCINNKYAIKREIKVSPIVMEGGTIGIDLWLDINSIGSGLTNSQNFKYVLTTSDSSCADGVVASGNFYGKTVGDTVPLFTKKSYSEEIIDTYYLYVWLDISETSSTTMNQPFDLSIGGSCSEIFDNLKVTFDANGGEFESIEYTDVGEHEFVVPYDGEYKLEVWGASGGYAYDSSRTTGGGGYGGYSMGVISLDKDSELYLGVGGAGESNCQTVACAGGYNGGSASSRWVSGDGTGLWHGGGGGATHISINNNRGELKNYSSNQDEVLIVAGGGGGGDYYPWSVEGAYSDGVASGGSGGGYVGGDGVKTISSAINSGGTQSSGYAFGTAGTTYISDSTGGSGGGWYGGLSEIGHAAGGGGSGYIGNSLLTDKYMYCYNCSTSDDVNTKTYTTTNVSNDAIANYAKNGDGAAKITQLNLSKIIMPGDKYGQLPKAIKEGYEFAGWNTEPDGSGIMITSDTIFNIKSNQILHAMWNPVYNVMYKFSGGILSNNSLIGTVNYTTLGEYTYNVPYAGDYLLEVWGASGGYAYDSSRSTGNGGYGGYSTGLIALNKGDALYIGVGGEGQSNCQTTSCLGGYNGGSESYKWVGGDGTGLWHAGGGGATHIAINNNRGELKNYSSNQDEVLIVAGGGGGGDYYSWSSNTSYSDGLATGGSGGGFEGVNGSFYTSSNSLSSGNLGGTQTSGYAFGTAGTIYAGDSVGGSGGGWYGGLSENIHGPGAGGSGYIGNSLLTDKYMYCYNCSTSDNETTRTYTTTNVSSDAKSNYAKSGNGAVRITQLFYNDDVTYTSTYGEQPDISRDGYSFIGWNTKEDGTGEWITSDSIVDINEDHSLYAIWEDKEFNVKFNVNGGIINSSTTSSDGNTTYNWTTLDDVISLNGNNNFYIYSNLNNIDLPNYNDSNYMNMSKSGYTVVDGEEWICLSGCSVANKVYNQNQLYTYSDFCDSSSLSCNITLGVNWREIYTISYNANNGSGAPESQQKFHGVPLNLSSIKPTRSGYKFLGWSTSSTATSASYTSGSEFTINDNITLYAVWKLNSPVSSYKCANGSAGSSPYFLTYGGNCTVIDDGGGNWRVKLLSTGTYNLQFAVDTEIDVFLVGGGGGGAGGLENYYSGGGGGGGYAKTVKGVNLTSSNTYSIQIGNGGSASGGTGGNTSAFGYSVSGGNGGSGSSGGTGGNNGGNGGSGYNSGSNGGSGNIDTREFGEPSGSLYSGGGGGGGGGGGSSIGFHPGGSGGDGGGGVGGDSTIYNGGAGVTNTGGGGGGGTEFYGYGNTGSAGGSGIVIIRNKR